MWYTGAFSSTSYNLGYATSPYGSNWTKHPTPVLEAGTDAWEAGGVGNGYVMPVAGGYKMWYVGANSGWTKECIGYATSTDGILWQKDMQNNPVLEPGISGEWDDTWVAGKVMLKDNIYYMWYLGAGTTWGQFRIGLATSSDGITNWTKHPANPVLTPSPSGWDGGEVEAPSVLLVGDTLYMYYDGSPSGSYVWQIGLAKSLYTPLPLPPGSYTVGTGGNFATIQAAFNKLETDGIAGNVTLELIDELYVAPAGQYGFLLNGPIPGAGPNSRVTIKPAENKNVVVQHNGRAVFYLVNISYLNFDGIGTTGSTSLTVQALHNTAYPYNEGILFMNNSDHNVIQNITFLIEDYLRESGFGFWSEQAGTAADSNLIQNNFVKKAGWSLYIYNTGTGVMGKGNIIRGNKIGSETDSLVAAGIQVNHCENTLIENNIIQNLRVTFPGVGKGQAGIGTVFGSGNIIRNNVIKNLRGTAGSMACGIFLLGLSGIYGNDNYAYNNMIYDINSTSIQSDSRVAGIQMQYQNNPKIYYNSVYLSGTGANQLGSAALYIYSNVTNADIKNNIFVNTRDEGQYCASAIYDYSDANLTSDYNDLYYDNTNSNSCLVRIGNTKYSTIGDWRATGKDLNSINEMPNFIAPNLHIDNTEATNLESHGTPITTVTSDFDGDPRHATLPDIGADEFSGTVVPVELTAFTAEALDQKVILRWTTATELNNNGFEIQRKVAESDFATVGFVRGEGTTTNQREYSYIDKDLTDGKYFYRLKQVDYNGTYEYSNEIEVDVRSLNDYALEQNYPNPFNPATTIGYVLKEKTTAKLILLNAIGEEVVVLVNEEQGKGYHKVDFNAANLPSGVYFYQLRAGEYASVKKMLLIK